MVSAIAVKDKNPPFCVTMVSTKTASSYEFNSRTMA